MQALPHTVDQKCFDTAGVCQRSGYSSADAEKPEQKELMGRERGNNRVFAGEDLFCCDSFFCSLSASPPLLSSLPVVLTSVSAELWLQRAELIRKRIEKKISIFSKPFLPASPAHFPSLLSLAPSQHPPRLLPLAFFFFHKL